jgi:hypothetical protein
LNFRCAMTFGCRFSGAHSSEAHFNFDVLASARAFAFYLCF